ncbi:MAG: ParB/RepB/Spo0J family partition protein [Candidatus Eremiobacteraeota bacterium]|nr:ParB/RepB/Spo0J family partition protein [Candidatus Eremiobacteraeota bacterium]
MSAPRRGLGRGLGALLGESTPTREQLRQLPVGEITPNPFQPRKRFDDDALGELRASIAEYGILVPIIVRERGSGFELIAGERRWRAAAALQLETVPAIVRESDDRDSLEVAIVENLQREDLGALEEAAGFAHLMEEYDFTQERLAVRLGKSRPAIANALRLLGLPDGVKALLADGKLTAGHARALLAAPQSEQLSLAHRCATEGLSVRMVERLAGAVTTPLTHARSPKLRALRPEDQEFEARLRMKLGTHIALRRSGKGGRIEIRYGSEKDLIRLGELLLGDDHPA